MLTARAGEPSRRPARSGRWRSGSASASACALQRLTRLYSGHNRAQRIEVRRRISVPGEWASAARIRRSGGAIHAAEGGAQADPRRGERLARRDTLTSAPPTAGAAPLPPKVPSTARGDCGKESGPPGSSRRRQLGKTDGGESEEPSRPTLHVARHVAAVVTPTMVPGINSPSRPRRRREGRGRANGERVHR
jgi:hypothetical protein